MVKKEQATHVHQILGKRTELYFSILCGVLLLIGFLSAKLFDTAGWIPLASYIISYCFGGFFITIEASKKIPKGEFDIDFLMIAAAAGAAYIGSWAEGA